MTVPPVISSSRLRQRRKVDLPLPEGLQHDNDLAFINISRYIAQNFQIAEVLLQMLNMNFYIVLIDGHG